MRDGYSGLLRAALGLALLLVHGCGGEEPGSSATAAGSPTEKSEIADSTLQGRSLRYTEERAPCLDHRPLRKPLFGDVHVHTSYSFAAAANTTGATP